MNLNALRRRWQQSRHPLVKIAKHIIWTPWVLYLAAPGLCVRAAAALGLLRPSRNPLNTTEKRPHPITVSLTSYGRRVSATTHLAITSIMRQSLKPDRIVLWLDSDNWSDSKLPKSLLRLKKRGLEIRYCPDIRSYKKLIPSVLAFPGSIIVTIDDDTYYKPSALAKGYATLKANPDAVVAGEVYTIGRADDGSYLPYRRWKQTPSDNPHENFPVGIGSTWWQPWKMHQDLTRQDLFTELAPLADDIWFYAMARLKGMPTLKFTSGKPFIDLDTIYQHYHGASLTATNLYAGANDTQLRAVAATYNLN